MRSWLFVASLLLCPGLAHAAKPPKLNERALREAFTSLKDPDSARIRNVRYKEKEDAWTMCGEVNGKNSMGAYAGYETFFGVAGYDTTGKKTLYFVAAIGPAADMLCSEEGI